MITLSARNILRPIPSRMPFCPTPIMLTSCMSLMSNFDAPAELAGVRVPFTRMVNGRLGSLLARAATNSAPVVTVTRVERIPKPPVVPPSSAAKPCGVLAQALKVPNMAWPPEPGFTIIGSPGSGSGSGVGSGSGITGSGSPASSSRNISNSAICGSPVALEHHIV